MNSLAGKPENILAAATNNASEQGGPLAELAASMAIMADTNSAQDK